MSIYGQELLIDLHQCDSSKFKRKFIENFFKDV